MALDIKVGDIVTFQRYDMSLTGTVTQVSDRVPKIMVDGIHYVDLSKVLKISHK